jgi:hypothetical protein
LVIAFAVGATLLPTAARSETPEEWIKLGARIHGAFGAFIPVGIRIGLDAMERLKAEPRGVLNELGNEFLKAATGGEQDAHTR